MALKFKNFLKQPISDNFNNVATTIDIEDGRELSTLLSNNDDYTYGVLSIVKDTGTVYEAVKVTNVAVIAANVNTRRLTIERNIDAQGAQSYVSDNTTAAFFSCELTAEALEILRGHIDKDLIPLLDNQRVIGTSDKRIKKINAVTMDVNTLNTNLSVPTPEASATIKTSLDTIERDLGCFRGNICINGTGLTAVSAYQLLGDERGELLLITKYDSSGGATGGEIIAKEARILNAIFTGIVSGAASFTYDGNTHNVTDIVVTNEDTAKGKFAMMTFRVPSGLTLGDLRNYLKTKTISTSESNYGNLIIQNSVHVAGDIDVRGKVIVEGVSEFINHSKFGGNITSAGVFTLKDNIQVLHKYDATAAPAATNDTDEGYSVGSTWYDKTNDKLYRCTDNTADTAVWKDMAGFQNSTEQIWSGNTETGSQTLSAGKKFSNYKLITFLFKVSGLEDNYETRCVPLAVFKITKVGWRGIAAGFSNTYEEWIDVTYSSDTRFSLRQGGGTERKSLTKIWGTK